MMNSIVNSVHVIQIRHANGDREELSGCDCDTSGGAVQTARLVERWLRGGVLYADMLPYGAIHDLFDLREYLGSDRYAVGVEVVCKSRGEDRVVWSSTDPDDDNDDSDDTDTITEWDQVTYTVDAD